MSTPTNPFDSSGQSNAYFVQGRGNSDEFTRLQVQDQLITESMGGVLAEQEHPESFGRVLDVGCGPAGWLFEVAKAFPAIPLLVGIDANSKMISYAQAQVQTEGLADRMEFHVMDALRLLDFPSNYFHLVNQRYAIGWLRTWEWPKLLSEHWRICQPGGIARLTEQEILPDSSSAAFMTLCNLMLKAFYQAGNIFALEGDGLTGQLARLLTQSGFKNVQTHISDLDYLPGSKEIRLSYEDSSRLFRTIVPFLNKWTRVPDNYEDIYQQAMHDMRQPDFYVNSRMLTAWGTKIDE